MVEQWLSKGLAVLVSTALLVGPLFGSNGPGPVTAPALPAQRAAQDSRNVAQNPTTVNQGVSYTLDNFDDPNAPNDILNNFIGVRGVWCEIDDVSGAEICNSYNLLQARFVAEPRRGDSGYALKLTYDVRQPNSLASYYEHLHNGDTYYDLSFLDRFHFWVKGEGNTVGSGTRFWVRFADKEWHFAYKEVTGVGSDWTEKAVDLVQLRSEYPNLDWTHMGELTIIFENNRGGSSRVSSPLAGTLYFDDLVYWDIDDQDVTYEKFLDLLERRAFRYFWEYADADTGLILERASTRDVGSIASVGFGLTALCAAKQRGWVTEQAATDRVRKTLNSFYDDPSDPNDLVVPSEHGVFYHFVNIHTGQPTWLDSDAVSTIDTALLMAGVLTVRECFSDPQIRTLATLIYEAADWHWFLNAQGLLYMCWNPPRGYECPHQAPGTEPWVWSGYNEAMVLYLLALGSRTHPIPASSWDAWAATYQWGIYYGYPVLIHPPGPLFAHQYPQAWFDLRNKRDAYVSYFCNSRNATRANRAYSRDKWYPTDDLWGFTASDGPASGTCQGKGYAAYGYPPAPEINDGTVAPTAVGGSIVFTPIESMTTLRTMYVSYHDRLWGLFGLKDSLNARCNPVWIDNDYIGIDVGIMVAMIENYRSKLIWNTFMRNPEVPRAMNKAGLGPDLVFLPFIR